jgi:hypothetical protein
MSTQSRHRRLDAIERRRRQPALRIVRTIVEPSDTGPRLVGAVHRSDGQTFERHPDETDHQFRHRAGLAPITEGATP